MPYVEQAEGVFVQQTGAAISAAMPLVVDPPLLGILEKHEVGVRAGNMAVATEHGEPPKGLFAVGLNLVGSRHTLPVPPCAPSHFVGVPPQQTGPKYAIACERVMFP